MVRRDKKKIIPDLIFSKFFLVFCVFIFFVVLLSLARGTIRSYKVDSEITDLQVEINNLDYKNQELGQLITYLKSDTFIEQEAKLNMGYQRPGEKLVIITDQDMPVKSEIKPVNVNTSNPLKWWQYFFN